IAGTYKGSLTTKGEYPKLNHLIELSMPFTFTTYDSNSKGDITVSGQVGDIVALEANTVLATEITDADKGKPLTIVYEGRSKNKKPGQRPAYLVGIYDGLPEAAPSPTPAVKAVVGGKSGFPFNKSK